MSLDAQIIQQAIGKRPFVSRDDRPALKRRAETVTCRRCGVQTGNTTDALCLSCERGDEEFALAALHDKTEEPALLRATQETPKPTPRRVKVSNETGIYMTPSGAYEINWREDGRARWQIVGFDLDEARATRNTRTSEALTPARANANAQNGKGETPDFVG